MESMLVCSNHVNTSLAGSTISVHVGDDEIASKARTCSGTVHLSCCLKLQEAVAKIQVAMSDRFTSTSNQDFVERSSESTPTTPTNGQLH